MADRQTISKETSQNITNVQQITKAFADTVKSFEKFDSASIKKSVAIYSDISKYLKVFLQSTQDMMRVVNESFSNDMQKEAIKLTQDMVKVVESSIKVVESIGNMKFPKMLKLRIQLWKFKTEFGMVLDMFLNQTNGIAAIINNFDNGGDIVITDKDGKEKVVRVSNISNSKNAAVALDDLVTGTHSILTKISKLSFNSIASYPLIKIGLGFLIGNEKTPGILPMILEMIASKSFKTLGYKKTQTLIAKIIGSLNVLIDLLSGLNDVVSQITIPFAVKAKIASSLIKPILQSSTIIINEVTLWTQSVTIDKKSVKAATEQVDSVKQVISSILSVIRDILLLALAAPALVIAFLPAITSVFIISLFMRTTIRALKIVAGKKQRRENLEYSSNLAAMVTETIGAMIIAGAGLLLLGLMGGELLKNIVDITMAFLITASAVIIISMIGALIKNLLTPVKQETVMGLVYILSIMLLINTVAGLLLLLGLTGKEILKNWKPILATFLITIAVLGVLALLGLAGQYIVPFIAVGFAMIALAALAVGAMLLLVVELKLLLKVSFTREDREKISENVENIIGTALVAITAIFNDKIEEKKNGKKDGVFATLLKSILKGFTTFYDALVSSLVLVLTVVAVAMLLIIAGELWLLTKINIDPNKVHEKITSIMNSATTCIDAVFGDAEEPAKQDGSRWKTALLHFFGGIADIIELVVTLGKLTLILISISFIGLIGLSLKLLNSIDFPSTGEIHEKVTSIMNSATTCIDAVFGDAEEPAKQDGSRWKTALLHFFGGIADIIEIAATISKLSLTLVAIGMISFIAKELKYISNIDLSEEIVTKKVNSVMRAADACVRAIFHSKENNVIDGAGEEKKENKIVAFLKSGISTIKNVVDNATGVAEAIAGVPKLATSIAAIGMIVLLGELLEKISKVKINEDSIISNTETIITSAETVVRKIFSSTPELEIDNKNIKLFDNLTKSLGNFVNVFDTANAEKLDKGVGRTIEFVDKINTVDLEKLQTAANMFEKMAEFSNSINGNFESLAKVLNEKIVDYLEKINAALENTNDKLGNNIGSAERVVNTTTYNGSRSNDTSNTTNGTLLAEIAEGLQEIVKVIDGDRFRTIETI